MREHTFTVTLTVKDQDREFARRRIVDWLNTWFHDDEVINRVNCPDGSLLHYSLHETH